MMRRSDLRADPRFATARFCWPWMMCRELRAVRLPALLACEDAVLCEEWDAEAADAGGTIDWFNHRRLQGEITDDNSYTTPAEFEAVYYRQNQAVEEAVTLTTKQS